MKENKGKTIEYNEELLEKISGGAGMSSEKRAEFEKKFWDLYESGASGDELDQLIKQYKS